MRRPVTRRQGLGNRRGVRQQGVTNRLGNRQGVGHRGLGNRAIRQTGCNRKKMQLFSPQWGGSRELAASRSEAVLKKLLRGQSCISNSNSVFVL